MNTMNDVFDRYVRECIPRLATRTQVDYRRHIDRALRPYFGHFVPGTIKPRDVLS